MFSLEFSTDNDAFAGDDTFPHDPLECARILAEVSNRVGNGQRSGSIRDFNGTTIGKFELVLDD